jgi:O-antigen/teichoic acid export membrane protein
MPFFDSAKNFKDTIVLFSGRISLALGTIISLRIISELINPAQLGLFYYIIAIGGFFSLVLFNPVTVYVNKSCIKWFNEASGRLHVSRILLYWVLAAFLSACILACYWYFVHNRPIGLIYIAVLVPCIILTDNIIGSGSSIINLLDKRVLFITLNNLQVWGVFGGTVAALLLINRDAQSMILGRALAQAAIALLVMFIVWKAYKTRVKANDHDALAAGNEVWSFCWPIALTQVFFWSQFQGFRIPLKMTAGEYGVGIFSVIFGVVVGLFAFFDSIFNQLYTPIFWKKVTEKSFRNIGSEVSAYLSNHWAYLIVYALWIVGVAPFAFRIFVADKYRGYTVLIVLVAISELVRIAGSGISYSINALNKNMYLLLPASLCFIICIGGVYFLGHVMDPLLAAGISLALSCFMQVFVIILVLRKYAAFRLPWLESGVALVYGLPLIILLFFLHKAGCSKNVISSMFIFFASAVILVGTLFILSKKISRLYVAQ